jgi:hypothetical protein
MATVSETSPGAGLDSLAVSPGFSLGETTVTPGVLASLL